MKAVVFYENGGVDKLTYTDVEKPKISPYEVLVKVAGVCVESSGYLGKAGLPGIEIPMPHILGSDSVGEVAEVGMEVKQFRVGDKVLIAPGVRCRKCVHCITNNDSMCRVLSLWDSRYRAVMPSLQRRTWIILSPISNKYSFEEWAAIPLVFLTAWHMLITRGQLKPGEDVLMHALAAESGAPLFRLPAWLAHV